MDHFFRILRQRDTMSEWVERFLREGAAADLDDLRVEVDDDLDHLEPEEAERLARKLKGLWLRNSGI